MSRPKFFSDSSVTGSGWTLISFGFNPSTLISIVADRANTDDLYVSFDGSTIHNRLQPGEPYNATNDFTNQVYLKPKSATQSYRLTAY